MSLFLSLSFSLFNFLLKREVERERKYLREREEWWFIQMKQFNQSNYFWIFIDHLFPPHSPCKLPRFPFLTIPPFLPPHQPPRGTSHYIDSHIWICRCVAHGMNKFEYPLPLAKIWRWIFTKVVIGAAELKQPFQFCMTWYSNFVNRF